jgi:hypothetical protein
MRTLICLALLAVASHSASATTVSFLKNSVYRIDNTNQVAAVLNDKVESNTQVGTGEQSMCELSLDDKSVTRIGANAVFSFVEQERLVKCDKGTFLVSKDPETETMTVTTGSVTAAVNGSTVMFDVRGDATHVAVAETTTGVVVTDKNGKSMTLQSGEGISATPSGMASAAPKSVDVKDLTSSSPLFTEAGLAPLANDALIKGVASAQASAKAAGMSFTSEINDVVAGRIDSATALARAGGMDTPGADVPDIDTAAGGEAAGNSASVGSGAGAISGSQQFNPLMNPLLNPNLVPPVTSSPNPSQATPTGSDLTPGDGPNFTPPSGR